MIRGRIAQMRRDAGVCAFCQHRLFVQRSLATAYRPISTTRALRQDDPSSPPSSSTSNGPRPLGISGWGAPSGLGSRGGSGWGVASFAKPTATPSDNLLSPHELEQRKRLIAQREEAERATQRKRPLPAFKHVFNAERQNVMYQGWQREAADRKKIGNNPPGVEASSRPKMTPMGLKLPETPNSSMASKPVSESRITKTVSRHKPQSTPSSTQSMGQKAWGVGSIGLRQIPAAPKEGKDPVAKEAPAAAAQTGAAPEGGTWGLLQRKATPSPATQQSNADFLNTLLKPTKPPPALTSDWSKSLDDLPRQKKKEDPYAEEKRQRSQEKPTVTGHADGLRTGALLVNSREGRDRGRMQYEVEEEDYGPPASKSGKREQKKGGKSHRGSKSRFEDEDEIDSEGAEAYEAYLEKQRIKAERKAAKEAERTGPIPIRLPELITISALASALKVEPLLFLEQLAELGFENITQDSMMAGETAALVAQEYGYEPTVEIGVERDLKPRPPAEDPSLLPQRPPIVTIMGHVDHGKTTLLDFLRKSSVAAQEHGGITQHIGAFSVKMSTGKQITFLDTPGHAAFLTMRQRGAHVTDIVVLVVAADDSVKPQTLEAIKHAQSAKVPIIVAINKVDKDTARVDQVKSDLSRNGVELEDFGGDVQVVCVSGKTGLGMDELEENIVTLAEILDMRVEDDGPSEGWILESSLKASGKVATVLVRRGTMRPGDIITAGTTFAKIRHLRNEAGVNVTEAGPGTAIEIYGWRELPAAGDEVIQAPDEGRARTAIEYREGLREQEQAATDHAAISEVRNIQEEQRHRALQTARAEVKDMSRGRLFARKAIIMREAKAAAEEAAKFEQGEDGTRNGPRIVNFAVKGDVHGSVEAVCASIQELGNHEVLPRILRSATGPISEFDVEHAAMSGSVIINFATTTPSHVKRLADEQGVKILDHNIIYHLVDDVKVNLSRYLAPDITSKVLGEAEVQQVFQYNTKGRTFKNVAGCRVRNGTVAMGSLYRVFRGGEKIFDGKLEALKNHKKDVAEMRKGTECGMEFEDFQDIREGDQIQAYEEIKTARNL
ncbi:translation initiation factor IF-2 [Microdochium nivale]|nr:translation initiation factor IF-2 [Microdochium nivale]